MSEPNLSSGPDLVDWVNRLRSRLNVIGESYLETPWSEADDPAAFEGLTLKQARAAEAVLAVLSALSELPDFERAAGIAPLHDLAGAMNDVVNGRKPRLFRAVGPSKGGDGIDRNYTKVHAVVAVNFLVQAHGYTSKDAREYVAQVFAKHGATGRKRDRLSASTLQDWCTSVGKNANKRVHREVDRKLAELKADPRWPGSLDDAKAWIDRIASHPLVASKYG